MTSPLPTTVALGDVIVGNGASTPTELGWQNITPGPAGTSLTSNGPGILPTFQASIIRKTTILNTVPGMTVGAGQPSAVRIANGTALQNAINTAMSQGYNMVAQPDIFEFSLPGGLQFNIPGSGVNSYLQFEGGMGYNGSRFIQFDASGVGSPVIAIGDQSNYGALLSQGTFDGIFCGYGVDVTGKTGANTFQLGGMTGCMIRNIAIDPFPTFSPYVAFAITNDAGPGSFFVNTVENVIAGAPQQRLFYLKCGGTNNAFRQLYLHNNTGVNTPRVIANFPFAIDPFLFTLTEAIFEEVNVEWCITDSAVIDHGAILFMKNCTNLTFNALHVEGCHLASSVKPATQPSTFIYHQFQGSVSYNGVSFTNCSTATSELGTVAVGVNIPSFFGFLDGVSGGLDANDVRIDCFGSTYDQANGTALFNPQFAGGNSVSTITRVQCDRINTSAGTPVPFLIPDTTFPLAKYGTDYNVGRYDYYAAQSRTNRSVQYLDPAVATVTVYGWHTNLQALVPSALAADITVTLSKFLGAAGQPGSAVLRTAGDIVQVSRGNTGAGHSLLTHNWDGTLLNTNNTAFTSNSFLWDGTNFTSLGSP